MNAPGALLAGGFREEEGLLVYVATGPHPDRTPEWFFDEVARLDPRRLLIDLRGSPTTGETARSVIYRRHRELSGRRLAVLGRSRVQEVLIAFLIAATGHRDSRYFTDEREARAWLRGDGAA